MDATRTTDGDLGYVESFGPGRGFAPARASQAMGSQRLSLNGTWKFRYRESLRDLSGGFEGMRLSTTPGGPSWWCRRAGAGGAWRAAGVHQRHLSVPARSALCPRPQSDGGVPEPLHLAGRLGLRAGRPCSAWTGSTRASRCGSTGTARPQHGQPAGQRVRCHRARAAWTQRAGGPGAPVVGRVLPGRPGHVVAVRHLPPGADQRAARAGQGLLRPRGLRPGPWHRGILRLETDRPATRRYRNWHRGRRGRSRKQRRVQGRGRTVVGRARPGCTTRS